MPDIFDAIAPETATGGDIFDEIAPGITPRGDIFDEIAPEPPQNIIRGPQIQPFSPWGDIPGRPDTEFTGALFGQMPKDLGAGLHKIGAGLYEGGVNLAANVMDPDPSQGGWASEFPTETAIRGLPPAARAVVSGGRGVIESAPQLALSVANPTLGAISFGLTPEGFDPKQAALAFVLPTIGKAGGAVLEIMAAKAGVTTEQALLAWNKMGGATAAAAAIGATELGTIAGLPPEQRQEAMIQAVGNVGSMFLLGTMGEHKRPNVSAVVEQTLAKRDFESKLPGQGPIIDVDARASSASPQTSASASPDSFSSGRAMSPLARPDGSPIVPEVPSAPDIFDTIAPDRSGTTETVTPPTGNRPTQVDRAIADARQATAATKQPPKKADPLGIDPYTAEQALTDLPNVVKDLKAMLEARQIAPPEQKGIKSSEKEQVVPPGGDTIEGSQSAPPVPQAESPKTQIQPERKPLFPQKPASAAAINPNSPPSAAAPEISGKAQPEPTPAVPEAGQPTAPVQPKPALRKGFRIQPRSDGIADVLDAIQEEGGIRSPGPEDTGGEYDGHKEVMVGTAALLRRRGSGLTPDKMIKAIQAEFPRIQTPKDLWEAIRHANLQRDNLRTTGGGPEAQQERFWTAATAPKTTSGLTKINVDQLQVGNTFRLRAPGVSNEELTVTQISPDTGEVTVKDGTSFGHQDLPEGAEIWVQKKGLAPELRPAQGKATDANAAAKSPAGNQLPGKPGSADANQPGTGDVIPGSIGDPGAIRALERLERSFRAKYGSTTATVRYSGVPEARPGGLRGGRANAASLQSLADVFGKRIVWFTATGLAPNQALRGFADPGGKYILLNAEYPQTSLGTTVHELMHQFKKSNPDLYSDFKKALLQLAKLPGSKYEKMKLAAGYGQGELTDELVSDFAAHAFNDPEFLKDFAKVNPGVFRRVINRLLRLIDRILAKFTKTHASAAEVFSDLKAARDLLARALSDWADYEGNVRQVEQEINRANNEPDKPFSVDDGNLFDAPESVSEQKARLDLEKRAAAERAAKAEMQDRAAARLTGRDIDTTRDGFANDATTRQDKSGQGSFFSVDSEPLPMSPENQAAAEKYREDFLKFRLGSLPQSESLQLGRTPEALRAAGIPDGVIYVTQKTLGDKPADLKHPYPVAKLARLPEALNDPILVHESWTVPDSFVALLDLSYQGQNMVAALHFRTTEKGLEVTEVASVYPREESKIKEAIERTGLPGGVTYYHKEKVRGWLAHSLGSHSPQQWVQILGQANIPSNHDLGQGKFSVDNDALDLFAWTPAKPAAKAEAKPLDETAMATTAEQPPNHIGDFGEKIAGARKETWHRYEDAMLADLPSDYADITLSKHFPQPDYESAIAGGADVDNLATMKALRDMIPPKPRHAWKLKRWGELVTGLHRIVQSMISDRFKLSPARLDEITAKTGGAVANKVNLYRALGYPLFKHADGWNITRGTFSTFNSIPYDPPKSITYAEKDHRWQANLSSENPDPKTARAEVIEKLRPILAAEEANVDKPGRETKFSLYQDRYTKEEFLGKKGLHGVIRIKAGFKTAKEAREYLETQRPELEKIWEGLKQGPQLRKAANEPRRGPDRRDGSVTPEVFMDAFGFRGVQFGNYVEGPRRQADLNEAYDALIDLSQVLSVPPKALSLNGSLGLAFGARGVGDAKAHYEPSQVVINITKTHGPGSLAHEWFHAFDNYFARLDATGQTAGASDKFATDATLPAKNVRPEVLNAFKAIRAAIQKSSFHKRSREMDSTRAKPYFGTTIEEAARAFEIYVSDRLEAAGIYNDYLANIYKAAESAAGWEDSAYPSKVEMDEQGIRLAMDQLFNALDTKTTDKGEMLFSVEQEPPDVAGIEKLKADQTEAEGKLKAALKTPLGKQEVAIATANLRAVQDELGRHPDRFRVLTLDQLNERRNEVAARLAAIASEPTDIGNQLPGELRGERYRLLREAKAIEQERLTRPEIVADILKRANALTKTLREAVSNEDPTGQRHAVEELQALQDAEFSKVPPAVLEAVRKDLEARGEIEAMSPDKQGRTLGDLTDWLKSHKLESPRLTISERVNLAKRLASEYAAGKDSLTHALIQSKSVWRAFVDQWKAPKRDDEVRTVLKEWHYGKQFSGIETHQFAEQLRRDIPKKVRREAISIWLDADGDASLLQFQRDEVPARWLPVWEAALNLTPDEQALALRLKQDFAEKLGDGQLLGLIEKGRAEYGVPQHWKINPQHGEGYDPEDKDTKRARNPVAKLDPRSPSFALQRKVPSYFDGIMAKGVPASLDISDLVAHYNLDFHGALADRAFIKSLKDARMPDGTAAVQISGGAKIEIMPSGARVQFVDSNWKPKEAVAADGRPYLSVDHWALRGWKFATQDAAGNPIMVQGDFLVHPDLHGALKRQLESKSILRDTEGPLGNLAHATNWALNWGAYMKASKFASATFHGATLAEHLMTHAFAGKPSLERLNLLNPWVRGVEINPAKDAEVANLIRNGMDLGYGGYREMFEEGLVSHGGIWGRVPILGDAVGWLSDGMFKEFLPRLKVKLGKTLYHANRERYSKKLTDQQIYESTASQVNAAFGGQNWALLGRSKTFLDVNRLLLTAPDFFLSRAKVVGQAFKPYNREQQLFLLAQAAIVYALARVLNMLFDDDPHWEAENAFRVIHKGRAYSARFIVSDLLHLTTDPMGFTSGRLGPWPRGIFQSITGRDMRTGARIEVPFENAPHWIQILGKEMALWFIPMGAEGFLPGATGREQTSAGQFALGLLGVGSQRYTAETEMYQAAEKFNRSSPDPRAQRHAKEREDSPKEQSDYRKLDVLLEAGEMDAARKEYKALIADGHSKDAIEQRFKATNHAGQVARPFTGSQEREAKFKASLTPDERLEYNRAIAIRKEREAAYRRMMRP